MQRPVKCINTTTRPASSIRRGPRERWGGSSWDASAPPGAAWGLHAVVLGGVKTLSAPLAPIVLKRVTSLSTVTSGGGSRLGPARARVRQGGCFKRGRGAAFRCPDLLGPQAAGPNGPFTRAGDQPLRSRPPPLSLLPSPRNAPPEPHAKRPPPPRRGAPRFEPCLTRIIGMSSRSSGVILGAGHANLGFVHGGWQDPRTYSRSPGGLLRQPGRSCGCEDPSQSLATNATGGGSRSVAAVNLTSHPPTQNPSGTIVRLSGADLLRERGRLHRAGVHLCRAVAELRR